MQTVHQPKTKRGKARRQEILRAAERVFGRRGFADASISEITREAGTAQGTLYIYFDSKEQIFRELVAEMGRMTRTVVSNSVSAVGGRLDAEREGLRAFLRFVAERPELYQIVEQARFVDPPAYRAYFTAFAAAYSRQLDAAAAAGEVRPGDAEIRAWALMGIAKTLGERYAIWAGEADLDHVVDCAFDLIENGLRP